MRRFVFVVALSAMLTTAPAVAAQQAPAAPPAEVAAPQVPAAPPAEVAAPQVPTQPPAQVGAQPAVQPPFPDGAKYAFVNVQRIANESSEGQIATAQVNSLLQKMQAESDARGQALQEAQQRLETGGNILSDAARLKLQTDIDRQSIDIQRFTEDAQQEVQILQQQLQTEFQEKLGPIIEQVAEERQLHMIFSVIDSGLVWGDAALDLTSDVIEKFNAISPPAPQVSPAAPQPTPAAPAPVGAPN